MSQRRFLSSLLLASSLLFGAACSSATTAKAPTPGAPVARKADALDRAQVRAALAARRDQSVARFLAYRDAGVYPVNSYQPGLQHVWVDELGNLCAAATIIAADWGRDATVQAGAQNNFLRLADVTDGPLLDWILTSGLTQQEIVAIQEPMVYEPGPSEIDRLLAVYNSVERQIRSMWDASLDDATDALMARPDLARLVVDGKYAGPAA
jgi:hypothetical protein